MTNGDESGGGKKPPPDDRTLLDPLSNEELQALREARKRMQAKKAAGKSKAIKHQIVIAPGDEDETTQPGRASAPAATPPERPTLPAFEGDVTLDQIRVPPRETRPASPQAASPSTPPSTRSDRPSAASEPPARPREPTPPTGDAPEPRAGTTGFGENTLMWMQPVRAPDPEQRTAPSPQDPMFQPSPGSKRQGVLRVVAGLVALALIGGAVAFLLAGGERGVVELSTQPPGAALYVNGDLRAEKTPVKLTLPEGAYTLRVEKDGFEPGELTVDVDGELDLDETIVLRPQSDPGRMTVTVEVEPIAATVTVDEEAHPGVQKVHVPNLDPDAEHRIRVEAGGFIKTEQVIRPGELQERYQFTLERDVRSE